MTNFRIPKSRESAQWNFNSLNIDIIFCPIQIHLLQGACKCCIIDNTSRSLFESKTTIKTLLFDMSTNHIQQESSYYRLCNSLVVFTQRRRIRLSRIPIVKIFSNTINTMHETRNA